MKIAYDDIRAGDRVTMLVYAGGGAHRPEFKPRTGRAVMRGPGGWVLNLGGPHGTPGVCGPDHFVKATGKRDRI
jgi:hypothetical protein